MKKYDYFLSSLVVASLGLNLYFNLNIDKFIEKEYTPEIIIVKEASHKTYSDISRLNLDIKTSTSKLILNKYKIASGREDPFKPLLDINIPQSPKENTITTNKRIEEIKIEEKLPFILRGILKGENKNVVILEREEKSYVIEEGKEIEGYKVFSVDFEKQVVVLQKENKKYKIELVSKR